MMTIELRIPDDVAMRLTRLSQDAESFALDAIQARLNEVEQTERLAEEYRFAAQQNESLLRDFAVIDAEHWDDY